MTTPRPSKLQTLLVLGRVSNLPTVWSNCLAAWLLAGGGAWPSLVFVSIFVTCLYLGGMFLNDAFDAGFDRNKRPTRPIPSGHIGEIEVWGWGFGWLLLGLAGLVSMGKLTGLFAALLAVCILAYNAIHKIVVLAPVIMGTCRFFVYLTAASIGASGVTGEALWKGLALAVYVVGLSCLARKETGPGQIQYWPLVLLSAPVCVALLFDDGANQWAALICSLVLIAWVAWTFFQTHGKEQPNIGQAVSRLLAGIALVDLLAVADFSQFATAIIFAFFLLAIALQSFIPAT